MSIVYVDNIFQNMFVWMNVTVYRSHATLFSNWISTINQVHL